MYCPVCQNETKDRYRSCTRTPAEKIYLHSKNHPKLKEANSLIEQARVLEREVQTEADEHRKMLIPKYTYQAHVKITQNNHFTKLPIGTETICLVATLDNEEIFKEHMQLYGSILNPPESTRRSVTYYRKYGLLFHDHGGWLLLKDEQPCSDEEWELLKQGNIPEKFLK